jgi:hypothetical protein
MSQVQPAAMTVDAATCSGETPMEFVDGMSTMHQRYKVA